MSEEIQRFDRGQPVTIAVTWDADPEEVYFAHLPPGEEFPRVDDGLGEPGSEIERLDADSFAATVWTEGFRSGLCHWRFWGETAGVCVVSKHGCFEVVGGPEQL